MISEDVSYFFVDISDNTVRNHKNNLNYTGGAIPMRLWGTIGEENSK